MLHVWYIYLHLGDFLAANVETYFSTMEHTEVSKNRGTLSHHPFSDGIFAYKPFILGDPYLWKLPYGKDQLVVVSRHLARRR